jgi:uncharacterized protein (DUF2384 family)
MGRSKRNITAEEIEQVEKLAPLLTQAQIADYLGISDNTLRKRLQEDEAFFAAYARGRARAIGRVAGNLVQRAYGGDHKAQEFYLRTQAGWSDKAQVDVTTNGKPIVPEIVFRVVRPDADE